MSSVKTRRQAAAVASPSTPTPVSRGNQVVMNGNGAARGPGAKDQVPKENIFLFYPNLIGRLQSYVSMVYSNMPQVISELSLPLHPYTTCHCILELAPYFIAYPASLMR